MCLWELTQESENWKLLVNNVLILTSNNLLFNCNNNSDILAYISEVML